MRIKHQSLLAITLGVTLLSGFGAKADWVDDIGRGDDAIYSTMANGVSGHATHLELLVSRLASPDLRIAIEVARGLGKLGLPDAASPMFARYDAEGTAWPLKVALIDAIGRIPRSESIGELRQRYGNETGRLRQNLLYAMHGLTHGLAGPDWTLQALDAWLVDNQADHMPDLQAIEAWRADHTMHEMQVHAIGTFYGLAIISDRPVFVLDTSASMRGAKFDNLKLRLQMALAEFPTTAYFNIADFGGTVHLLQPQMIDGDNRIQAFRVWTEYQAHFTRGTRMFDAMELAAGVPGIDTAIVFTDGVPIGGQFQHPDRISAAWKVYARYCPIALQGVVFGGRPNSNSVLGMRQLTQRFTGATVHAE